MFFQKGKRKSFINVEKLSTMYFFFFLAEISALSIFDITSDGTPDIVVGTCDGYFSFYFKISSLQFTPDNPPPPLFFTF